MESVYFWNNCGVRALGRGRFDESIAAMVMSLQLIQQLDAPQEEYEDGQRGHGLDFSFQPVVGVSASSCMPVLDKGLLVKLRHPSIDTVDPLATHQMTSAIVMFNMALAYHAKYKNECDTEAGSKARRVYLIASECLMDGIDMDQSGVLSIMLAATNNAAVLAQELGETVEALEDFQHLLHLVEWAMEHIEYDCETRDFAGANPMFHDLQTNALIGSLGLSQGYSTTAPAA